MTILKVSVDSKFLKKIIIFINIFNFLLIFCSERHLGNFNMDNVRKKKIAKTRVINNNINGRVSWVFPQCNPSY